MRRMLWAGLFMLLAARAQAQTTNTLTLQYPSDTVGSAQLLQQFPNSSNVNGIMTVGNLGSSTSNAESLLRFNVSGLEGKYTQIESITLTLNVADAVSNGVFGVYAVSPADAEWGTSPGTAPTWNYQEASSLLAWAGSTGLKTAGVDYTSTALAVAAWSGGGATTNTVYTLKFSGSSSSLTSLVNGWISATNGGLLITSLTNSIGANVNFYGGVSTNAAPLTPELTFTYESTSAPEPDCWLMFGASLLVVLCVVKCRKQTQVK